MESSEVIEEVNTETEENEVFDVIAVHLQQDQDKYDSSEPRFSELNSSANRGKYYKQTYRAAWEQMPDFQGWLRGVCGEPTRAYCTYCQKTLHAHRLSLLKHTCTIRHQKAAQMHNSKKNKTQMSQEIHHVILQEDDLNHEEVETEEGETIEFAEVTSEVEDDDPKGDATNDGTEEEDEEGVDMQQVSVFKQQRSSTGKNPISTHVLDSTKGCPITSLQVSLYKLIDGRWTYINEGATNATGRFSNFIHWSDFVPGRYKLHYDVDRYFEARKQDTMFPFIEVVFDCKSETDAYHVPLLLSPFGYTTYKGV